VARCREIVGLGRVCFGWGIAADASVASAEYSSSLRARHSGDIHGHQTNKKTNR
jgi:hypothetical protein